MGKGDKKSKRGKIVLGTYGARRLRKKSYASGLKSSEPGIDVKGKPVKSAPEVRDAKNNREKPAPKEAKAARAPREAKAKKEKTAE